MIVKNPRLGLLFATCLFGATAAQAQDAPSQDAQPAAATTTAEPAAADTTTRAQNANASATESELRTADAEVEAAEAGAQAAEADAAAAAAEAEAAEASAQAAVVAADAAEAEAQAAEEAAAEAEAALEEAQEDADEDALTAEEIAELRVAAEAARADADASLLEARRIQRDLNVATATSEQATARAVDAEVAANELERQLANATGVPFHGEDPDAARWTGYVDVGGSLSLNSSTNVPSEARGLSVTAIASLNGVLDFRSGNHEWRNSLMWDIGATRSAADSIWLKSVDRAVLETGYYYRFSEKFGYFFELKAQTSLFPLQLRRGDDVSFCLEGTANDDGTCTGGPIATGDQFRAGGPFEPFRLDESTGVYYRPLDRTYLSWVVRGGLAAQQFFVSDDTYTEKDENNDIVELAELSNYHILGLLADTELRGAVNEGQVQWGARASLLFPVVGETDTVDSLGDDISPLQVDLGGFVDFTVAEWLGFRVSAEGYRQPQVTGEDWQTRVNFLLTFSHTVFGNRDDARGAAETLVHGNVGTADGSIDL